MIVQDLWTIEVQNIRNIPSRISSYVLHILHFIDVSLLEFDYIKWESYKSS